MPPTNEKMPHGFAILIVGLVGVPLLFWFMVGYAGDGGVSGGVQILFVIAALSFFVWLFSGADTRRQGRAPEWRAERVSMDELQEEKGRLAARHLQRRLTDAFEEWLRGPATQLVPPGEDGVYTAGVGEFAALALATIITAREGRAAGPLTADERRALEGWCEIVKRRVEVNVRV